MNNRLSLSSMILIILMYFPHLQQTYTTDSVMKTSKVLHIHQTTELYDTEPPDYITLSHEDERRAQIDREKKAREMRMNVSQKVT